MKILLLSEHIFSKGGTAVYTENIARHLVRTGNTVHLITHAPLDYKKRGKWVNLEDNLYLLVPEIGINQYNTRVSRRALLKSVYKLLFKNNMIQTIKPDIVHVLYGHTIAKILKPLSVKLPTFWTIHNIPPAEYPLPSSSIVYNHFYGGYLSGIKLYHRRLIRSINPFYYIAISEFIRRKLIKHAGIEPDRIKVVNPGVELKDFFPVNKAEARQKVGLPDDRFILLTVGGFIYHKGQFIVLEALNELKKNKKNILYIMIGQIRDQAYYRYLQKRIDQFDLNKNVLILQNIPRNILNLYYNACDVYIQPSLEEGFCLSALEALATGCFVIGTDVGGIRGYISISKNGIVLRKLTKESIINALTTEFIQKSEYIKRIRDLYSWQHAVRRLLAIYKGGVG